MFGSLSEKLPEKEWEGRDSLEEYGSAMKDGPLEGVKVVELASWVAVPTAAAILSDWGASVIKVENVNGGDPHRGIRRIENIEISDINFWWELDNRGKRGVAVDIRKEQGGEVVRKLVKDADVFLTNVPPQSLERRGLGYESLIKLNPRLIYLSFTGYGEVGVDKDKPGHDITSFWARGGFMHRLKAPDGIPTIQPIATGDQISSGYIAGAVSTALFAREKTGRGQKVSLSLYHNAVWALAYEVQTALSTGMEIRWRYLDKVINPLWNIYQTKDGRWIQLACLQSDRYWYPFCEAIEREDLKQDARFDSHLKREENNVVLISLIKEVISKKTSEEWERAFRKHDIVYEKAQSIEELVNDPQAVENGFFAEVKHPSGRCIKLVNSPVKFSETPSSIRATAPELGQHTEEVLLELGYDWDDIQELKEQKIII